MTEVQEQLPTYADRLPFFKQVETRILSILLDNPHGLIAEEILDEYKERFRHHAEIPQRLRHLRQQGEVTSAFCVEKNRLVWKLSEKWRKKT